MITNCPQCGGNLQIDILNPISECEYCNHKLFDSSFPNNKALITLMQREKRVRNKLDTAIKRKDYIAQERYYRVLANDFGDATAMTWTKIWRVLLGKDILENSLIKEIQEYDLIADLRVLISDLASIKILNKHPIAYAALDKWLNSLDAAVDKDYLQVNSYKAKIKHSLKFIVSLISAIVILIISYTITDNMLNACVASVAGLCGVYICLLFSDYLISLDTYLFKTSITSTKNQEKGVLYVFQDGIVAQFKSNVQRVYYYNISSVTVTNGNISFVSKGSFNLLCYNTNNDDLDELYRYIAARTI